RRGEGGAGGAEPRARLPTVAAFVIRVGVAAAGDAEDGPRGRRVQARRSAPADNVTEGPTGASRGDAATPVPGTPFPVGVADDCPHGRATVPATLLRSVVASGTGRDGPLDAGVAGYAALAGATVRGGQLGYPVIVTRCIMEVLSFPR